MWWLLFLWNSLNGWSYLLFLPHLDWRNCAWEPNLFGCDVLVFKCHQQHVFAQNVCGALQKKQSGKYRENHFVYSKHFLGQTPHLLDAVMLAKAVASVSWFVWPRVRKITKETSILFGVNCQHLGNGCLLGYRHFGVKGSKLKFDGHLLWNTFVIMLVGVTVWN